MSEKVYTSLDALKPVGVVINEAAASLEQKDRTESDIPQVNAALGEAGKVVAAGIGSAAGGGVSFAALYLAGLPGLSAAGITSGLAAAGALVGGGMVAGLFVLAAPVAVLGIIGYAAAARFNEGKLLEAKELLLQAAVLKQNELIIEIERTRSEDHARLQHLSNLNVLLQAAIRDLQADLAHQG